MSTQQRLHPKVEAFLQGKDEIQRDGPEAMAEAIALMRYLNGNRVTFHRGHTSRLLWDDPAFNDPVEQAHELLENSSQQATAFLQKGWMPRMTHQGKRHKEKARRMGRRKTKVRTFPKQIRLFNPKPAWMRGRGWEKGTELLCFCDPSWVMIYYNALIGEGVTWMVSSPKVVSCMAGSILRLKDLPGVEECPYDQQFEELFHEPV